MMDEEKGVLNSSGEKPCVKQSSENEKDLDDATLKINENDTLIQHEHENVC